MSAPLPSRRGRARLCATAALGLLMAVTTVQPASAWKPKTHIYLAEEVLRDAVADGKVTLYETDYATGRILAPIGQFDVDPKMLAALKAAPRQFRAGVLGPDAYPDIATGQTIIHPQESHAIDGGANGSNAWLTHVWNEGFVNSSSPQINAFALGYLTHAAGDVFAHTYVNHFAGGEFMLTPDPTNAIKHLVLEGYIGKRTPTTISAFTSSVTTGGGPCNQRKRDDLGLDPVGCGVKKSQVNLPITGADTSIDGVEGFILNQMTVVAPGSILETRLYKGSGTAKSVPYIFSTLRNGLAMQVADYDRIRMSKTGPDRLAYAVSNGPAAEYKRAWIEDIDRGLAAWPRVSHELAKALVYNEAGADMEAAKAVAGRYARDHLISMLGAPDVAVMTAAAIGDLLDAIIPPPLKEAMSAIARAPVDFIIMSATGMTPTEWADHFKNPEAHFDRVLNAPGGGHDGDQPHPTTLARFNREELKIADDAYGNPALRWKIDDLPAAFNTVQLTKLALLGPAGQAQLRQALEAKGATMPAGPSNLMLGWVNSLDHGNQWQGIASSKGAAPQPAFAAGGGRAYQKLFLKVTGEKPWTLASTPAPSPDGSVTPPDQASPAPATPTPAPQPPLPRPADAISVADLAGDWWSAAGVFRITKTAAGVHVEVTRENQDSPSYEADFVDGSQTAKGEWRMAGGTSPRGTMILKKGKDGAVIVTHLEGSPLGGQTSLTLTRAGAPEPGKTADEDDDWLPPAPPEEEDPIEQGPVPAPKPPTGSGSGSGSPTAPAPIPVGGGFKAMAKWDVRVDRVATPRDDKLVHVYLTFRNATKGVLFQTQGVQVRLEDSEGVTTQNGQSLRPVEGYPQHFPGTPVVDPGRELKAKFVFSRQDGATPRRVIVMEDGGSATFDVGGGGR